MSVTRFEWFTRDEAAAKLAAMEPNGDNHADRVRLDRRANLEVTTAAERAAVRAYNALREKPNAKTRRKRTSTKGRDKSPRGTASRARNRRK